jgi:hypothetical protein
VSAASLEQICAELAAINERLADLSMEALREAIAAGESKRPDLERRITRARHAVERAIGTLQGASPTEDA